jgi:hypothetical protein
MVKRMTKRAKVREREPSSVGNGSHRLNIEPMMKGEKKKNQFPA